MTNKLEALLLSLKVVAQESQGIQIEFSVLNLIKKTQIWLYQDLGITMSKYGIFDNRHQLDQSMGHTFVVIQSICMTDTFSLAHINQTILFNSGISVLANQLKTSIGMKVFHLKSHAWSMVHNSRRTLVTWLSQEVVVQMKLKYSTVTTCSNHVHRSEIWVEPASQLISATAETCSHAVVEMVLLEFSMWLMRFENNKKWLFQKSSFKK